MDNNSIYGSAVVDKAALMIAITILILMIIITHNT